MHTTAAHAHANDAAGPWPYAPSWNSLKTHPTPRWFQEAKFGIYTHWGIYCVPARGPNATWYPYNMYREGTPQYAYHVQTYGDPSRFGYKDFIPMFTAEKFDPDEWAELFQRSGARYAGWASTTTASACGTRAIPIGARPSWAPGAMWSACWKKPSASRG